MKRKVWTPKPSIMRKLLGMARSDIAHMIMCIDSGSKRDEIPERVMRGCRLRNFVVRFRLNGVDEIGKLDRILNEEDRHVVTNQIVVPFLRIKLDGKAPHVAGEIG